MKNIIHEKDLSMLYLFYPCTIWNKKYRALLKKYYDLQAEMMPNFTKEQLKQIKELLTVSDKLEIIAMAINHNGGYNRGFKDGQSLNKKLDD